MYTLIRAEGLFCVEVMQIFNQRQMTLIDRGNV